MTAVLRLLPLVALAVAACGPSGPAANSAPALAGVNLGQPIRALGTEPFWNATLSEERMTFKEMGGETLTASHAGYQLTGTVAVWSGTAANGTKLEVTLTGTDCSDGMSDRTYPLTAKVQVGDKTLNGCAALESAIANAGESGRVQ